MYKFLLLATALTSAINVYAMDFKAEVVDEAKKTCRIVDFANPSDQMVSGTVALPSVININNYPYTVTAVKQDAINDLLNATKVIIPASITTIGYASASNPTGDIANFNNCPKLETFEVKGSNSWFKSTSTGLLTAGASSEILVRVPQAIKLSGGQLKLPTDITTLGASAFTGVTTVTTLSLGPVTKYESNCGINSMPWCSDISIYDTKSTLKTYNGVLADPAKSTLIAFPARKMQGTFSIPSEITKIGESAFANAFYLSDISFSNITDIGKAAFMKSRLRKLALPSTVKTINAFAFADCDELTSLTFKGAVDKLPAHMAKGSAKLTTVTYNAALPKSIGNGAFADCVALTQHPFSNFEMGDSAFFNTGFETVIFDNSSVADNPTSVYSANFAFANCKNLTKIDMTSLVTTPDNRFNVGDFFVYQCPQLTEILFPAYSHFQQSYIIGKYAAAIYDCRKLKKMILGCYTANGSSPLFILSPTKPDVFMKIDGLEGANEYGATVKDDFASQDGGDFKPIFYWESPYPSMSYVINNATYYVPGGAMQNFSEAIDAGCYVEEFYRLKLSTVDNGLVISLKEVFPDMVKLKKVATDAVSWTTSSYGNYPTAIPTKYVKYVKITYEVHGVEFTTTYDREFIEAADSDDITGDIISDATPRYFNLQGTEITAPIPGEIYIIKRGPITTKEIFK